MKIPTIMKITAIIGVVISVLFAIFADSENAFELALYIHLYYPLIWLIICIGTKQYFKEPVWEATLITSPVYIGIFGFLMFPDFFVKYVCFGVVLSLLLFEYRITNKK